MNKLTDFLIRREYRTACRLIGCPLQATRSRRQSKIKQLWQRSLISDERGETFWHHLGSAMALVLFFCLMIWILSITPAENERHPQSLKAAASNEQQDDRD